jgi:DNA-binding transcriptional LysR family regulator
LTPPRTPGKVMKKLKELNFDLKQMRTFLEVLNENSFTRASRKLRVGQATISHHISQLEKALGVTLIRRTARDVSVTAEGKIFQSFCKNIFKDIENLAAELGQGAQAATARIAASTIPAAYLLPAALAAVKVAHPEVSYRLEVADSREAVEMVKEGRADIGIVGREYRNPALVYMPLCMDEIVLIGTGQHPARVAMEELMNLPFIVREPGSGTRKTCEEELARHGIKPSSLQSVLECSSTEGIKGSVAAGLGVSFVSRLAVRREAELGTLKIIEVAGLNIRRHLYFVHPAGKSMPYTAALLLDSLLGGVKKSGGAAR